MSNIYQVHYNGARPFQVQINDDKTISISEEDYIFDENGNYVFSYPVENIKVKKYEHIFIDENNEPVGNTILIKLDTHKYMYIGAGIYEFDTEDEIVTFTATMGNSDVPYPYATGKENTYLLLNKIKVKNIDLKTQDPYHHYYNYNKQYKGIDKIFSKYEFKVLYPDVSSKEYRKNEATKRKEKLASWKKMLKLKKKRRRKIENSIS